MKIQYLSDLHTEFPKAAAWLDDNHHVEHVEHCRILFATLRSKIEPENAIAVEKGMSDFTLIWYQKEAVKPQQYNAFFEESLAFLESELQKPFDGKTIVVTHHVPTLKNYPQEYIGSAINNGFATELEPFILRHNIDARIYGHHRNVPDFYIGKTLLTTNQLSHLQNNECPDFKPGKVIDTQLL